MKISGAEIRQRLREGRWHWWLPAAFFVGICFLPSGWIEASPGEVLRPPVLFAPMAWPLLAMGFVFGAAAFSIKLGRYAWHILFLGTGAALIFNLLLIASSGAAALYSWELGTDLQDRIFTDFELDILAFFVQPMALLLLAVSALVLWARGGKPGPEPQELSYPAKMPQAEPAPLELPAVPATGPEAEPAEVSAPQPAASAFVDSPLDAIAPGSAAPAETPALAPVVPAGPVAEASTSAPPAPGAPEKAAGAQEFTP